MKILSIRGAPTVDEEAAVRELLTALRYHGGRYSQSLLDRLPLGRVVVHVASDAGAFAVMVIEDGELQFHPMDWLNDRSPRSTA